MYSVGHNRKSPLVKNTTATYNVTASPVPGRHLQSFPSGLGINVVTDDGRLAWTLSIQRPCVERVLKRVRNRNPRKDTSITV